MGIFNVIFHILLLCSHLLSANVCDVEYTKQPTNGHRCVASSNTEVTLRQTDRPQCMLKCLQLKTCRYINHNYDTGQCDLGLDKCESLVPAIGVEVNVFGPHRDACEHWAPRQRLGHVLVEVSIPGDVMYLARIKIDKTLLVGKFINGWFWGNNEGVRVEIYEAENVDFLTMNPACTLAWIPYTAGDLLPVGAISGGLLPHGSITYVSKVTHNDLPVIGYYNTQTELVYYELAGAHTKKSMEILVLLWEFLFLANWHIRCLFHWEGYDQ